MKLGDAVHEVLKPVVKVVDAVAGTDLQNCGKCQARRQMLNNFGDAVYDELYQPRKKKKQQEEKDAV